MLFAFFDLIHELGRLGQGRLSAGKNLRLCAALPAGHVYELFPMRP